jgi:two-component system, cell cycle sensor histidine kinase and response regulator CckA
MSENNGVTNGAAIGAGNPFTSSSMVPSDAQLRSVFESLDEGLVVADRNGRILHWNPASLEMHGFPNTPDGRLMLTEFTRIFELSTLDGRVLSLDEWPVSCVLRGERLHQREYHVRRLDRDDWNRVFSFGGTTFFDSDGKTVLAVLTLNDITERKRAEEALRQSDERARSLFDTISGAVVIYELTPDGAVGRFLEVNSLYCQHLGYTREELLSLSPKDLDDPATGVSVASVGARLREKNEVIFDQILIARDGTRIPVEIHAHLMTLGGRPAVIASVRDMSERKRAERALRESEQRLTQAVNLTEMGIFEHDHITGVFHCSQIFRTMFGFGEETVSEHAVMERVFPEDREALTLAVRQSYRPKGIPLFHREHRIVLADGIAWILVRAETFFEGEGEARHPVRTVGATVDITERKHAELELLASRRQLSTALDAAKLGIWSTDLKTGAISGDGLARSIFGWAEGEVVTTGMLLNRIVPEDLDRFNERQAALTGGLRKIGTGLEYRIQLPGGRIRWVSVRGTLVRNSSGKPEYLTGVVQDITGRKRAEDEKRSLEQQFLHAQKMEAVGRLAGGIAHDFNNLLMVIRSYTEMMQDSLPAHDPLRKNTREIMKAADRAASLTGQMLAFSRKQVLSPVALNLNAAVAESAKMLQRLIGDDVELQMSPADSTWVVRADPVQIAQVLMNLSVNARDAMPEGGTLTIATRNFTVDETFIAKYPFVLPGDYAVFSAADTGTGISKEVQERMFEPFFTTKSVGKGTGLGLSTVYGIVKQSGGYLLVDSEPGQGSCFTVYLPRVKDTVAIAEMIKTPWLQHGTETLLVVEDEDALRESIGEFLGALGYKILSAESGLRALTIAAQFEQPIDLMITDVVMPKMSGRELSQMLGSLRPQLKTIFMSGYTDDEIVRQVVRDDKVAFLQKPFSLATLSRKLRDVLGKDSRPI